MKKIFRLFAFGGCVMLLFSLLGCGGDLRNEKIAEATFDTMIECINHEDKEGLKSLFSETAIEEATDLDSEIDLFFNWFDGEIITVEKGPIPLGERITAQGCIYHTQIYWHVYTKEHYYTVFIYQITTDEIEPKNEGIYAVQITDNELAEEWEEATGERYLYDEESHAGLHTSCDLG
ncbi:MAG: DUF5104 domain-containing protein [Oscillospiraceae bacterium]|nr:DUF5104 domain-containing protein [Oscillospiraceae bacterium]